MPVILFNEFATDAQVSVSYANQYERDIEAIKRLKPTIDRAKASNNVNRNVVFKVK